MKKTIFRAITGHPDSIFKRAIFFHKKYEKAKRENNIFLKFILACFANHYATKYNLELYGELGDGIKIWHSNVVINGDAKIGKNVQFHGNNCIGYKNSEGGAPIIGDNVEIGYGAVILGGIYIADGTVVAANSVVVNDFLEKDIVIGGVPAKKIKNK